MQPAKLVAVGIAQISKVELAEPTFAIAGRLLTRRAARFDASLVPGVDFFGTVEVEPDRPAIGVMRRLAVDRPGNHEHRSIAAIGEPALVVLVRLLAEQRVVEFLRPADARYPWVQRTALPAQA